MTAALLLPAEVGEQLRVPARRVLELRRQGYLTGINVGTTAAPTWRFASAEVARFIRERTSVAA